MVCVVLVVGWFCLLLLLLLVWACFVVWFGVRVMIGVSSGLLCVVCFLFLCGFLSFIYMVLHFSIFVVVAFVVWVFCFGSEFVGSIGLILCWVVVVCVVFVSVLEVVFIVCFVFVVCVLWAVFFYWLCFLF